MSSEIVSIILGSIGTTTGIASLAWNIYNSRRDRGILIVSAYLAKILHGQTLKTLEDGFVAIRIVNSGKRKIQITSINGQYKESMKESHFMVRTKQDTQFPKMLEPMESWIVQIPQNIFEKPIKWFGIYDSTGKIWKVRKREIVKIHKSLLEKKVKV